MVQPPLSDLRTWRAIVEFIRPGQSINDWSELVTIQFLEGNRSAPIDLMSELRDTMTQRCPNVVWVVLDERADSVLYEWVLQDCEGQDDQHEIARLLRGNDGLHRVAYTQKGPRLGSVTSAVWRNVFLGSYVMKGDEIVSRDARVDRYGSVSP